MKKSSIILVILIMISLVTTFFVGIFHIDRSNYREVINEPPSINYIEEDLEETFLTTYVCVLDYRHETDEVLCKVKANELYYKVLYSVKRGSFCSYYWELNRYIQIKGDD